MRNGKDNPGIAYNSFQRLKMDIRYQWFREKNEHRDDVAESQHTHKEWRK